MTRRGSTSIQFALILVVLLGFSALAVDRSLLLVYQSQMQNGVDAVAHAAAAQLDGTEEGIEAAGIVAAQVAASNRVGPRALALDEDLRLELGTFETGSFVADSSDPSLVTAARVVGVRDDLYTFFARVAFGQDKMRVGSRATAQTGGLARTACPLPIGIPSCALPADGSFCSASLSLGPDGGDDAGWAIIGHARPSASSIRDAIESCSMPASTDEVVSLNNGVVNAALAALADAVSQSTERWDTAAWGAQPGQANRSGVTAYGNVLSSHLIVFDDPNQCNGTRYNATSVDVTGFLSVAVYDVVTSGAAADRRIHVRSECDTIVSGQGGGGYYGTRVTPHLVQ